MGRVDNFIYSNIVLVLSLALLVDWLFGSPLVRMQVFRRRSLEVDRVVEVALAGILAGVWVLIQVLGLLGIRF